MSRTLRLVVLAGVVASAVLIVGTGPASAGSGPALFAHPKTKLADLQAISIRGRRFTPGDQIVLIECLRTATNVAGCDAASATAPVTVAPGGHLPKTSFTVMAGVVGTGTCGTSDTDAKACAVSAEDLSAASTLVASVKIRIKPPPIPTAP
jgi:hypothetical protein